MPVYKRQLLLLTYPENTDVQSTTRFIRRRLRVHTIRDLCKKPLTPREFLRRPLVNRGRWLVLARDIDRRAYRQFYLASSKEFYHQPEIKVGLFENGSLLHLMQAFQPTRRERILASHYIKKVAINDFGPGITVGVYTDDLRAIA